MTQVAANTHDDYVEQAKEIFKKWHKNYAGTEAFELRDDEVYVVWFVKVLQNWKALVATARPDGMYYELTYNGDREETYVDAYSKVSNTAVPNVTGPRRTSVFECRDCGKEYEGAWPGVCSCGNRTWKLM